MSETIKNHPIKITVISLISLTVFLVTITMSFMGTKAQMDERMIILETRTDSYQEDHVRYSKAIDHLETRCAQNDVVFATIETKLSGIETLLLEIRSK